MSKNLKLKKVIKSFVPEPISCFSDSYMFMNTYERFMHVNILVVFLNLLMLHNYCYLTLIIQFNINHLLSRCEGVTSSSSSSCRAASTDIPDPLSPLLPIIHRLRQVFRVTSCVLTELLYVGSCWSSCFCTSICGGPQEYIAYELVLASPAVSRVSGSSNLYSFRDGRQVAV